MALSARNRLTGEVTDVDTSGPTAEVTVETEGGKTVAAVITSDSVDRLGLSEGETVDAVIKATDVMIRSD
jgi:molybdate transport system regulatory protein